MTIEGGARVNLGVGVMLDSILNCRRKAWRNSSEWVFGRVVLEGQML